MSCTCCHQAFCISRGRLRPANGCNLWIRTHMYTFSLVATTTPLAQSECMLSGIPAITFFFSFSFFVHESCQQLVCVPGRLCHPLFYLCGSLLSGFFTWWGCCGLCFWRQPSELAHSFLFCSCVCFCLYGPFDCISFHKFSRTALRFLTVLPVLLLSFLVLSMVYIYDSLLQL